MDFVHSTDNLEELGNIHELQLPPLESRHDPDFRNRAAHATLNTDLNLFRAQNPFIEVLPFPDSVQGYKLTANVAQDVNLVDDTKVILISFTNGANVYATRKGNAQIPGSASVEDGSAGLLLPAGKFFWVRGLRQLSLIADTNCVVTVWCYIQL